MRKRIAISTLIAILMFAIGGCGNDAVKNDGTTESTKGHTENVTEAENETVQEIVVDESKSVHIELKGDSAICDSKDVSIKENKVCINNDGTYIVSGELTDGMLIVDCKKTSEVHIVLNGVSITSKTSAALYVVKAGKVCVTLNEGTENELVNGGSFEAIDDNNIDGAVFSKNDITFRGTGKLTVTSPSAHGIVGKKNLAFESGNYTITAASHAVVGEDSVKILDGMYRLTSGKDGIHSENAEDTDKGNVYLQNGNYTISSEGDGISASGYLQIKAGEYDIIAGGGSENGNKEHSDGFGGFPGGMPMGPGGQRPERPRSNAVQTAATTEDSTSMKGIKAGTDILIIGGDFKIDSADDAIHSNISVDITGGTYQIKTGDDGIHADEDLTIKGGDINIAESYEGLEGVDIAISGGNVTLVATDDGINSAGGNDESGFGGRDKMGFGGHGGGHGGMMSAGNGTIVISGGTLRITSSGDGIDANGSFEMTGGDVIITGPTVGDTATLDYDTTAVISGGTFIGTGASGMAQTFSESKQGLISIKVGNCTAGTTIIVKDEDGKEIINHSPELNFAVVIVSSPEMEKGQSYTVSVGEDSESIEAN